MGSAILTHEQIITLQCLHGCGVATVSKIGSFCHKKVPSFSLREYYDFIGELVNNKRINRFKLPSYSAFQDANKQAKRIIENTYNQGISIVSKFDADFPKMLLETVDEAGKPSVPILLYFKGDLSATNRKGIAIIGTREPTKEGIAAGEFFGKKLASLGVNIVSGLALGCDSSGHRGALDANGITTAFLAHGLDSVYPPENKSLAERIIHNGGLLMSEYEIGQQVNRYNLVARDRLQAALSSATIVIQTGISGGTMHAVNATLASHKPLYAVRYKGINSEKALGNEFLIQTKGAIPLTSGTDIGVLASSDKDLSPKSIHEEPLFSGLLFNIDDL